MATITKVDIKNVKTYCKQLIQEELSQDLIYHGWSATKENISKLRILAKKMNLPAMDLHIAELATYFLNTGFVKEDLKPYEASLEIAMSYMQSIDLDSETIESVAQCIRLKLDEDRVPNSMAEKVFYDTAYAYFGEGSLKKRISASWSERNFLRKEKVDLLTTLERKVTEMQNHVYYTSAATKTYAYKKSTNLIKLKSSINKEKVDNNLTSNKTAMTMFKTALRNHIDLINIADKKAGIMISINAILMTMMIPILGSYIIDISKFLIPSIILILTCGIAVILATLATRPQLNEGDVERESVLKGEKSLFYFGNFYDMEKADYRTAVKDVIVRDITLENSIINDLYDMGVLLGLKYKRLRWCYLVFACGIALTLITFVISFFAFPVI